MLNMEGECGCSDIPSLSRMALLCLLLFRIILLSNSILSRNQQTRQITRKKVFCYYYLDHNRSSEVVDNKQSKEKEIIYLNSVSIEIVSLYQMNFDQDSCIDRKTAHKSWLKVELLLRPENNPSDRQCPSNCCS
jgi:hypothetical protein